MIKTDDLTEDQIERVLNTPIFRRALAYKHLSDGIESLKEDDQMFDQLVRDVNAQAGGRVKEDTTRRQLNAFVEVVEEYTALVEEGEGAEHVDEDLTDLVVDKGDEEE